MVYNEYSFTSLTARLGVLELIKSVILCGKSGRNRGVAGICSRHVIPNFHIDGPGRV
jgi:hypothetical protein